MNRTQFDNLTDEDYLQRVRGLKDLSIPMPDGIPQTLDADAQPVIENRGRQSKTPQGRPKEDFSPPSTSLPKTDGKGKGDKTKSNPLEFIQSLVDKFQNPGVQSERSQSQSKGKNPKPEKPEVLELDLWMRLKLQSLTYFSVLELLSYLIKPLQGMGLSIIAQSILSLMTPQAFITPLLLALGVCLRFKKYKQVEFCAALISAYLVKYILVLMQR